MPSKTPFRVLLLLVAAIGVELAAQDAVAWAWVAPVGQGATFSPHPDYQFTPGGAPVTVDRAAGSQNRFFVTFPGLGAATGVMHATAYGGNHVAVVNSWWASGGGVRVDVELFTPGGGPADDGAFTVHYRRDGDPDARQAYLWAHDPSAVSYTPNVNYSWNGNRPNPWINRAATGYYYVYLYDLAAGGQKRGHVQVTPYGSFHRCKVREVSPQWGPDVLVTVNCFDAAGNLTDGRFVLSYHESAAPIDEELGSGAHVRSDDATIACHVPSGYFTDSNGLLGPADGESICREGVGSYRVHLPNVAPASSATAQVTTYDTSTPDHATIRYWVPDGCGGTEVVVDTWDAAGNPADARFSLLFLTNRPVVQREVAWAWVNPYNQGATFYPAPYYQYNSAGGGITVDRFGGTQHVFEVRLPGMAPQTGAAHVSAVADKHTAVIRDWREEGDDVVVEVAVFRPDGSPADDEMFNLLYRRGGSGAEREAYVFAHSLSNPSYTPTLYWNAGRPAPVITRLSTGRYRVSLPGLAPLGTERGHVQVSPVAGLPLRAKVESWGAGPFATDVTVRCTDLAGNLTDGRFFLSYHETAAPIHERSGSGAHVWAGNPTAASYAPHPDYTDSNGTLGPHGAETVTRLSTGNYVVELPDVAPDNSATMQVSAYGTGAEYASIYGFTDNGAGGSRITVRTFDPSGVPADAAFTLLHLTNRPALVPAENIVHSNGCHGPVLRGISKPALCREWRMFLENVPATAVIAFVQLGLSNPAALIGPQAPGCRRYTDGAVTVLVPVPVPGPTYAMTIPPSPDFVGLALHAQGGAFVPGVNPLSLATSNGLIGVIGY